MTRVLLVVLLGSGLPATSFAQTMRSAEALSNETAPVTPCYVVSCAREVYPISLLLRDAAIGDAAPTGAQGARDQSTPPLTLDGYLWAQQYEEARKAKSSGKMWMIVGGGVAGFGLVLGAASGVPAVGVYSGLLGGGPAVAIGYLGYRSGSNKMKELEANRPTTQIVLLGSGRHALTLGPKQSVAYRLTW